MTHTRAGAALLAVLLGITATAAISSAAVFAAARATQIAHARSAVSSARLGARSSAAKAFAAWSSRDMLDLELGATRTMPSSSGDSVSVLRAGDSLFLIRAVARPDAFTRSSVGLLVRVLRLRELWTPFQAAVAAAGDVRETGSTTITVGTPADSAVECRWALDSLLTMFTRAPARTHTREDDATLADSASFSTLGPLDAAALAMIADRVVSGRVELDPVTEGEYPLIFSPGDLTVTGGRGQGVLVVLGNLAMQNASFAGPILVAGTADITSSDIRGALRAGAESRSATLHDADIAYSPCAIARALLASPALNRAFRPSGRWWIPQF